MKQEVQIFLYGDSGLMCNFGDKVTPHLNNIIWYFREQIQNIPGVLYTIPSYNKITVYFDKDQICAKSLCDIIKKIKVGKNLTSSTKIWEIPVCYDAGYELDLTRISDYIGLTKRETIKYHCSKSLYVYGYGFLPGHPKFGDFDLSAPLRLPTPRKSIPAGSVGWVGYHGGIYPNVSSGGWNIIGRTPLKMFDINKTNPCKIKPGDSIQFYPITKEEFNAIN